MRDGLEQRGLLQESAVMIANTLAPDSFEVFVFPFSSSTFKSYGA